MQIVLDWYAVRSILEYWLLDPEPQTITVLPLRDGSYGEVETFRGSDRPISPTFTTLQLGTERVFGANR